MTEALKPAIQQEQAAFERIRLLASSPQLPEGMTDEDITLIAKYVKPYLDENPWIDPLVDPVTWVNKRLNHQTAEAPYQEEIIRAPFEHRRTAIRAGQDLGKSHSVADAALAYFNAYDDAVVVTTAPTKRQVETILWGYIRAAHTRGELSGEQLRTAIRINDLHYMLGFATATPENFQGIHSPHILVIVDEASGLNPILEEAIEGMLTNEDARLILVGNPTKLSGMFYDAFHAHGSLYHKMHLTAFDSPNFKIPPEKIPPRAWYRTLAGPAWVEERKVLWGESSPMYQIRVLGNFPVADEFGLIPVDWLERATQCLHLESLHPETFESFDVTREEPSIGLKPAELFSGELIPLDVLASFGTPGVQRRFAREDIDAENDLVAALDVARFGDNESSLYLRQGFHIVGHWSWSFCDTMGSCGKAKEILTPYLRDGKLGESVGGLKTFRIDTAGVGGGVYDRLRELAWSRDIVEEFNSAWVADEKSDYHDKRAEAYWQLRDILEFGFLCNLTDERTRSQLSTLRWKTASDGRIVIESKPDMRKRGLPSPDRADSLAMCTLGVGISFGAFVAGVPAADRPWRKNFSSSISAAGADAVSALQQQLTQQTELARADQPSIAVVEMPGFGGGRSFRGFGSRRDE